MCGILHYILDEEDPADIVATLYRALPRGSYVFIHHLLQLDDPASATLQEQMRKGVRRAQFRTLDEVKVLFGDLELVDPGLVLVPDWRPDPVPRTCATTLSCRWPAPAWPVSLRTRTATAPGGAFAVRV